MVWSQQRKNKEAKDMSITVIRHKQTKDGFAIVSTAFDGNKFYSVFQVYKEHDNGMTTLESSVRADHEEKWCIEQFNNHS